MMVKTHHHRRHERYYKYHAYWFAAKTIEGGIRDTVVVRWLLANR